MSNQSRSLEDLASTVRERVLGSGVLAPDLRTDAVLIGGHPDSDDRLPAPYDVLVRRIGEASFRLTDAEVGAVRSASGSDRATFELVLASSIGAGLARWDAAVDAIQGATDASR